MNLPKRVRHESFGTAVGTFASYAVILAGMTLLLFVIPFLVFLLL